MGGRAKPVVLSTRTFETQTQANLYFKEMLNRYGVGDRVSEADELDLRALLQRHNEVDDKVGCGISHFEVMHADFSTQCFCVARSDGSRVDFSYQRCIDRRHT